MFSVCLFINTIRTEYFTKAYSTSYTVYYKTETKTQFSIFIYDTSLGYIYRCRCVSWIVEQGGKTHQSLSWMSE